ncbi:vitamin B12 transporter [Sphingobium subterraneum]|uniref:Vitamin B12 transporter n=1 Tax=Sphingobium subterraneum TaxID=627688 RepID=A0A841IZ20_9SPHN|nr:vitamin B12 transporter [Sphingobium subterraneum]
MSTPAFAEPDAGAGDAIVVTAGRTEQPLSQVGSSVTVIDAAQIEQRQTAVVLDLLRTVPGTTIARNGGVGNLSSVFLRGASADHTVALIDGVKINDPSATAAGYDFGRMLIGNIDRIEIVRGSQSVLWGSQAIGGVVNMITREPTEDVHATGRAEYGYRNTADVVGNVSGKFGPVSASVGGGYYRTDGVSAFNEDRGGREKDGYRQFGANAKVSVALSEAISVDLRGWYTDDRAEIDGFASTPPFAFGDTDAYTKNKQLVGYSGLDVALFDGKFRNRFGYAYTRIDRDSYDPAGTPKLQDDARGRNERWEYQGVADLTQGVLATFGAETEESAFRDVSDFGFGADRVSGRSRLTSVYGQLSVTPTAGLTLTGGARYDHHNDFGGKTSFAGNVVYSPNGGSTTLRASYGEGFKAPSLYQLSSIYGNTALRPETSKSWDVGVTQQALDGAIVASATWFDRKTRNLIDFTFCNALNDPSPLCVNTGFGVLFGFYDNVRAAKAHGLELTLTLKPVEALTLQSNYSYVASTDRTTGLDLQRRPRHSVNSAIDYRWPFGLSTGATITHVGASFDDVANNRKLQGYVLVDLRASFPLTQQLDVYGRVENLFDSEYETARLYGSLGRAAYVGVRLRY